MYNTVILIKWSHCWFCCVRISFVVVSLQGLRAVLEYLSSEDCQLFVASSQVQLHAKEVDRLLVKSDVELTLFLLQQMSRYELPRARVHVRIMTTCISSQMSSFVCVVVVLAGRNVHSPRLTGS